MPFTATISNPTAIFPDAFYPIQSAIAASGISATRFREAAKNGIEIDFTKCGKRVFVKGSDLIEFIERLAAHYAASKEAQS